LKILWKKGKKSKGRKKEGGGTLSKRFGFADLNALGEITH